MRRLAQSGLCKIGTADQWAAAGRAANEGAAAGRVAERKRRAVGPHAAVPAPQGRLGCGERRVLLAGPWGLNVCKNLLPGDSRRSSGSAGARDLVVSSGVARGLRTTPLPAGRRVTPAKGGARERGVEDQRPKPDFLEPHLNRERPREEGALKSGRFRAPVWSAEWAHSQTFRALVPSGQGSGFWGRALPSVGGEQGPH